MTRKNHLVLDEVSDENLVSSQAVLAGNFLFTGGISSRDLRTNKVRGRNLGEQCHFVFETLGRILAKAGLSFSDIVKLNVYLRDGIDYDAFNGIYKEYFTKPYPARLVLVQALFPKTLVEVEAVALLR